MNNCNELGAINRMARKQSNIDIIILIYIYRSPRNILKRSFKNTELNLFPKAFFVSDEIFIFDDL